MLDRVSAIREMLREGLKVRDIARRLGTSAGAIYRDMRKHAIKSPNSDVAMRKKSRRASFKRKNPWDTNISSELMDEDFEEMWRDG